MCLNLPDVEKTKKWQIRHGLIKNYAYLNQTNLHSGCNSVATLSRLQLSPSKKTFQKPNILRRKTKVTAIKSGPCKLSLAPTATTAGPRLPDTARNNTAEDWGVSRPGKKVQLEVLAQDVACRPSDVPAATSVCTHTQEMMDTHDQETNVEETLVDEIQHNTEPEVVDVEAFLNGGQTQYKTLYEAQSKLENSSVQKWQIDFENDTDEIIMEPYDELQEMPEDKSDADLPSLDCDLVTIRPGKFKCDEPDCNKAFVTEQKLRRHRGVHNKQRPPPPPPPPAAVECPAGEAAGVEGEGGRCRRVFAARDQLARHLREDHGPKDALHGCEECGRRFFWAVGLRAHARAHAAPGALHHCLWPGCGRAFRQPCRLREHARAHTGDRPYRCKHPGCPWAFRTASKLLRHARRHTGERRHACACGRAFRRREHLREHQARHRRGTDGSDGSGRRVRSRMPALPGEGAGAGAECADEPGAGEGAPGSPALDDEFTVSGSTLASASQRCHVWT